VQRDGLVRLDRDRQGVLRVFQGPQLRLPAALPQGPGDELPDAGEPRVVDAPPAIPPADAAGPGLAPRAPAPGDAVEIAGEAAAAADEEPSTGEPGEGTPAAEAAPRRRRKAGTAAPRTKSTTARKPRARAAVPRKKKTTETE
jgi:hypothetical protein